MTDFPPGRAAALSRLQAFLPSAGVDYARDRNHAHGAASASGVSRLSPYLRHRLLGEDEIVRAVLGRFAFSTAEKFIQEVCWRSYWKGWLELRPAIWTRYRQRLAALTAQLDDDEALNAHVLAAVEGRSGIDGFDAWAHQLVDTGYLHNHARMWFASIWIFTLRLPWELGADFFLHHLLDGDPASNTLSWRWVAGLQTQGKHYLARAENIARYTDGRFNPAGQLDETAGPLPPDELPAMEPLAAVPPADLAARSGWLLHEDDLQAQWPLTAALRPVALVSLRPAAVVAPQVRSFVEAAFADARSRAATACAIPDDAGFDGDDAALIDRLIALAITQLVTAEAPVGPARAQLDAIAPTLALRGIRLIRIRRDWDAAFWPQASRGFFQLREKIRPLLRELGIP